MAFSLLEAIATLVMLPSIVMLFKPAGYLSTSGIVEVRLNRRSDYGKIYSKMKAKLKRLMARINNDDPRDDYPHPPSEDSDSSETPADPITEELKRLREEARQNRVRVYAGY